MHDNSIHTFYQSCACTLEDATLAQIASQIWQFASRIKPDKTIGSVHDTGMLSCFFLKICLMTITQHAYIYNFHTSNLCLKKYFILNFYQCCPYHNAATRFLTPKSMTMASAGAIIRGKYSPDGGVQQWHLGWP